jgi:hypothetical protein
MPGGRAGFKPPYPRVSVTLSPRESASSFPSPAAPDSESYTRFYPVDAAKAARDVGVCTEHPFWINGGRAMAPQAALRVSWVASCAESLGGVIPWRAVVLESARRLHGHNQSIARRPSMRFTMHDGLGQTQTHMLA